MGFTAVFYGGDTFKFRMLKADMETTEGLDFARTKAFEEFESKFGKSVRIDYKWEICDPIRRNPNTDQEEIIQSFNCETFFMDEKKRISTIVQDSLLEVEAIKEEKKKLGGEKKTPKISHSVPNTCAGCKELERRIVRLEQSYVRLEQSYVELELQLQKNKAQQDQRIAELYNTMNSFVLPMQKIHLRVLLHNLLVKVCSILGQDLKKISNWYDYLNTILASPEQLKSLNMGADIIKFLQTRAKISKLNDTAHEADQERIAIAVLAVQDSTARPMWERVFISVYGVEPTLEEVAI
jgi:hypothetical protein